MTPLHPRKRPRWAWHWAWASLWVASLAVGAHAHAPGPDPSALDGADSPDSAPPLGWSTQTLRLGAAPLRWAMASADSGGGPAVAYAFEEADSAWVGVWPDIPPTEVARGARVACLRLTPDRLWVGLIIRDPAQPTARLQVEAIGRDGARLSAWSPTEPALWPDVGGRCALLPSGDAVQALLRGRASATPSAPHAPLDLWWLSSAAPGRPLGLGPSLPQLLSDQADGDATLVQLLAVDASTPGARAWTAQWFRLEPDGTLASAPTPPPAPPLAAGAPVGDAQVLYQRARFAMVLRADARTLEVLIGAP